MASSQRGASPRGQQLRRHRRAAARSLVEHAGRELAAQRQRQRARDRCRAEREQVRARRLALAHQREPLRDAEALLLVDDDQPEAREGHALLRAARASRRRPRRSPTRSPRAPRAAPPRACPPRSARPGRPSARASGADASMYCSASTPVGTSSAHWYPAATHWAAAASATAVLPVPTSPRSSRRIGSGVARSARDGLDGALLGARQREPERARRSGSTAWSSRGSAGARAPPARSSASARCHTRVKASTHARRSAERAPRRLGGHVVRRARGPRGAAARPRAAPRAPRCPRAPDPAVGDVRATASATARRSVPGAMPERGVPRPDPARRRLVAQQVRVRHARALACPARARRPTSEAGRARAAPARARRARRRTTRRRATSCRPSSASTTRTARRPRIGTSVALLTVPRTHCRGAGASVASACARDARWPPRPPRARAGRPSDRQRPDEIGDERDAVLRRACRASVGPTPSARSTASSQPSGVARRSRSRSSRSKSRHARSSPSTLALRLLRVLVRAEPRERACSQSARRASGTSRRGAPRARASSAGQRLVARARAIHAFASRAMREKTRMPGAIRT